MHEIHDQQNPALLGTASKRSGFEFSPCLSRACLGKMFVFKIYKWLNQTVFTYDCLPSGQ